MKRIFTHRAIKQLLCALLLVSLCVAAGSVSKAFGNSAGTITISLQEYERLKRYELLDEVHQVIDAYYFEEPDEEAMMDGAISGFLAGLGDAYTFYYPQKAWETLWEDDTGKYAGIGVQLLGDYEDSSVTVTRVFRDTPAEEAGIRKGDVFFMVEDLAVTTATMQDAVSMMRGVPGEQVHVEMLRNGEILSFDIVKAQINVNRLESTMLDEAIGYITLYEFAGDCAEAFEAALSDLEGQGAQALILDLRDNPGGWVGSGISITDMFFDNQLLFYTQDRAGNQEKTYGQTGKTDIPLVILINGHSASTSEIVSAAMKDYGRATLVGTKTFGKGIVQDVRPLGDGQSGFQYTFAQFYSPSGNKVHKTGVLPDLEVPMPDELLNLYFEFGDLSDPQLMAAYDEALRLLSTAADHAASDALPRLSGSFPATGFRDAQGGCR